MRLNRRFRGLLTALVLLLLPAMEGGSVMAAQQSLADIFESYHFQERYFSRDLDQSVLSAWGEENTGRLHWTYLQNQYDPVKTGKALLEVPLYAEMVSRVLVVANEDLPGEERDAFFAALTRLLPEAGLAESRAEAGNDITTEAGSDILSEDGTEEAFPEDPDSLYGMDTLFGLVYIDRLMMDENDPADSETYFTLCRYAKKALYFGLLQVYEKKGSSSQADYLTEQLSILSGMDADQVAEAETYETFLQRSGEQTTEKEGWPGRLPILPAAGSKAGDRAGHEDAKLTLMIYMCGSDLEGRNGAATLDLMEMMRSGFDESKVNVLVMTGGTKRWLNRFSTDETSIYEIHSDGPVLAQQNPQMNMGEQETLEELLTFGYEYYPAEKYALILWDHGGGPLNGVCWDMLFDSDNLRMEELEAALAGSPFQRQEGSAETGPDSAGARRDEEGLDHRLEWIGFDACLMSSLEVAHTLSPYAKYMIASQETEPGCGWSYAFLKDVEKDTSGADTGRRIVDLYFEDTKDTKADLTLACMDLEKTQLVENAMDVFFSELSVQLTENTYSAFSTMRQGTKGFGRAASQTADTDGQEPDGSEDAVSDSDRDLADLTDLVTHYAPKAPAQAEDLLDALSQMIVCSRSNVENSSGLSVYHPFYNKFQFREKWENVYQSLLFSPGYVEYLQQFTGIWLGEQLGDWKSLLPPEEGLPVGNLDIFSMQLTADQIDTFASAQLVVLEGHSQMPDIFTQVYVSDDVILNEDGLLSARYTGQTLYVMDENEKPLCGPLHYSVTDGRIYISANYYNDEQAERTSVIFVCSEASDSGELTVLSVKVYNEQTESYSNRLQVDPDAFDSIYFPMDNRVLTYGEDGLMLPFDKWEQSSLLEALVLYLPQKWHFGFSGEQLSSSSLYAAFLVTDTQLNMHSSSLIPVHNRKIREMDLSGGNITGTDYNVTFTGSVMETELNSGIVIQMSVENKGRESLRVSTPEGRIIINDTFAVDIRYEVDAEIPAGQTQAFDLAFEGDTLPGTDTLHTILLPLSLQDNSVSVLFEPGDVSLTDVTHQNGEAVIYAGVTDPDGVRWELLDLDYEKVNFIKGITGTLHCVNTSDNTVSCTFSRAVVDGTEMVLEKKIAVLLQPGQEKYIDFKIDNERFFYRAFEHAKGGRFLVEKDVLYEAGILQLHSIALAGTDEEDNPVKLPFVLGEPYEPDVSRPADQTGPDTSLRDNDRTEFFDDGGLHLYVQKAWVIDRKLILVLDAENTSSEDMRYRIWSAQINGEDAFLYLQGSLGDNMPSELLLANSTARRYLEMDIYDGPEDGTDTQTTSDQVLETAGFMISQDDESSSHMQRIQISFPAGTMFDLPDGKLLRPSELDISITDIGTEGDPLVAAGVELPEDAESCRRKLRINTAMAPSAREGKTADHVMALIVSRVADKDKEKFQRKDGSPVEGQILICLAQVMLEDQKDGTFAGTYTGLIPMAGDSFIRSFMLRETGEDGDTLMLRQVYADVGTDVFVKEEYMNGFNIVSLGFDILLDYKANTAVVENYRVTDFVDPEKDYTSWPAQRFDMIGNTCSAVEYTQENGQPIPGEDIWILDNGAVHFDEGSLHLALRPVTDFGDDIQILYLIDYTDGERDIIEEAWEQAQ